MLPRAVMCVAACLVAVMSAAAFTVRPDSGVILVWQQQKGSWTAVKDSATVGIGDSMYLDDNYNSKLFLGRGCALYLRGELRAAIGGNDSAVTVYLDQGQVFLKRESGAEAANVKLVLRKCAFVPVGTAAAIKFTKQGEPTAAVLSGKIRIEPPKGEPLIVTPGNFGIYDPVGGSFKEGKLPPDAIASLESWSGTRLDQETGPGVTSQTAQQSAKDTAQKISQPAAQPAVPAATPQPAPAAKQEEPKKEKPKQEEKPQPAPVAQAAAPGQPEQKPAQPASAQGEKKETQAPAGAAPGITWELSAGSVTVGDEQWTRLAFSPDIPIWKFGIGLDVELFIDAKGDFSNKGWQFDKDNWVESLARKIRYLRFGYENDPVFVKVGGLTNVTFGYGFVVDRFTNMLHYPDQKLLGFQFYLNNISPIGITVQTMVSDFLEFQYKGGLGAARLAVCPLKPTGVPVLSGLSIGATYGVDLNEFAPAHNWSTTGDPRDLNHNGVFDVAYWRSKYSPAVVDSLIAKGDADTSTFTIDTTYRDSVSRYAVAGADIGLPLITSDVFGLDLYGQAAIVADTAMVKSQSTGWGLGAPGVAVHAGPANLRVEYRHIEGRFIPGYFGPYYLDERVQRYPVVLTKSRTVPNQSLNGVFGILGANIANVLLINGSYQYLMGKSDAKDQRLEASAGIGDALVKRIPKLTKVEAYLYKSDIGSTVMKTDSLGRPTYDQFFDLTPSFYWGYRLGVAITQGASLIWDARFGYQWDINHKLVPNNNMGISTAITF
ncbi:MAG TPA: hypothetical protein VLX68_03405 [Chitinivibrionales bacterium]|nr:hypothetical protein [Chitinivibrionales bacterium]